MGLVRIAIEARGRECRITAILVVACIRRFFVLPSDANVIRWKPGLGVSFNCSVLVGFPV